MTSQQAGRLDRPVDADRDHVLGDDTAEITLVEYGSYACRHCRAAHQVVANLRDQFRNRLRYVYRHLPLTDRTLATHAAELAEYVSETERRFWEVHDLLMSRSHDFSERRTSRRSPPNSASRRETGGSPRWPARWGVGSGTTPRAACTAARV